MPPRPQATPTAKLGMKHTKRELLDAYQELAQQLQGVEPAVRRPSEDSRRGEEAITQAMRLTVEGVLQNATDLRLELRTLFTKLANRITGELNTFEQLQLAIEVKERALRERHRIEASVEALAELEAAHRRKQAEFREEMEHRRLAWEREQADHDAQVADQRAREEREQTQQSEAFQYAFKREQQMAQDAFKDKMARLLAEQEAMEEAIRQRETALTAREQEFKAMEKQIKGLPQVIERAVEQAVKETTQDLQRKADQQKALLQKQAKGEKGVLNAKLKALEARVKEQNTRLERMTGLLDQAQQHLQTIAIRGIDTRGDSGDTSESSPSSPTPQTRTAKKSVIPPLSFQSKPE